MGWLTLVWLLVSLLAAPLPIIGHIDSGKLSSESESMAWISCGGGLFYQHTWGVRYRTYVFTTSLPLSLVGNLRYRPLLCCYWLTQCLEGSSRLSMQSKGGRSVLFRLDPKDAGSAVLARTVLKWANCKPSVTITEKEEMIPCSFDGIVDQLGLLPQLSNGESTSRKIGLDKRALCRLTALCRMYQQ